MLLKTKCFVRGVPKNISNTTGSLYTKSRKKKGMKEKGEEELRKQERKEGRKN
jgi:hypothetical protein